MYVGGLNMAKYEMYKEQLSAFKSLDQMRFISWSALIFSVVFIEGRQRQISPLDLTSWVLLTFTAAAAVTRLWGSAPGQ